MHYTFLCLVWFPDVREFPTSRPQSVIFVQSITQAVVHLFAICNAGIDIKPPLKMSNPPSTDFGLDRAAIAAVLKQILPDGADINLRRRLKGAAGAADIHFMFTKSAWDNLSDDDWVRISPALVLASRLLESSEVMLFVGSYLYIPTTANSQGLRQFSRSRALTALEITNAEEFLRDLASTMTFEFTERCFQELKAHGMASGRSDEDDPGVGRLGRYIDVELETRTIRGIGPLPASETGLLLATWLLIAITLVHEVMHAVHLFHNGVGPEPFFETESSFCELEYSLEDALFEGKLSIDLPPPVNVELPERTVKTQMGVLMLTKPQFEDPTNNEVRGNIVKEYWLRSLFGKDFWQAERLGALQPGTAYLGSMRRNLEDRLFRWA